MAAQGTTDDRIRLLERTVERLSQQVETFGRLARLGPRRNPRLAITAADPDTGDYVTPANQYWIKFVDVAFDDQLAGVQSVTNYRERQTDALRTARVIGDAQAIDKGAAIEVFQDGFGEDGARWWIPPLGESQPIVGVPPLNALHGIVLPVYQGWFTGRVATYSPAVDLFSIGAEDVWVRSLNCHPLEYIVANWMGFAKSLGPLTIYGSQRPAYVIETVPHQIEWGVLQSTLNYRGTATARLIDTGSAPVTVTVHDMLLQTMAVWLAAGTVVTIGRNGCFRGVISASCG